MEVKNLLDEEIERMLSHIESMEYGTEAREAVIDELNKLYKLRIDEEKIRQEYEKENVQKADQIIERRFRYGTMLLELIVPLLAYGRWYHKGLIFEKTNVVASPMVKNLLVKLLPRKK